MRSAQLVEAIALLAVLLFAVASVKTFFREGVPPGWDHPPHLVCSYLTSKYFLPRILGWDPYNNFGWVFNQFYNPGAYLLVALIDRALLGFVDIVTAYKIALVVTYLLPALGAYALSKTISRSPTAAILAALLALIVLPGESEWLDAGLKQIYYIGMWPQRLGVGLALLALAAYLSSLEGGGSAWLHKISLASLLSAGTILSHLMTGISLLIAETVIATAYTIRRVILARSAEGGRARNALRGVAETVATFSITAAAALGFVAFWLVPLSLTNSVYHNLPTITWHTGPWGFRHFLGSLGAFVMACAALSVVASSLAVERTWLPVSLIATTSAALMWTLSALWSNDGYIGLRLLLAALFSLTTSLLSRMPGPAILASVSSVLLVVATGPESYRFQVLWWSVDLSKLLPFSEWYAYYKFSGLARYSTLTLAALGLSMLLERAYASIKRLKGSEAQVAFAAFGLTVLFLIWIFLGPHLDSTDFYYPLVDSIRFKMDLDFLGTADMVAVMEWVRDNVPRNTYVFYQDTLWKLGDWNYLPVSHYFYLSSLISGRPQVGGGFGTRYITHPLANTETDHLLGQPIAWLVEHPERVFEIARELGISYFVIFDSKLAASLRARPEMFREVYARGPFQVFETATFNPIVSIDEGRIVSVMIKPGYIGVRYSSSNATFVRVRQVFFPGWLAHVSGRPAALEAYYPDIPSYVWVPGGGVVTNYRVPFIRVAVPPGEGLLQLRYELVTWGDAVTALTALVVSSINIAALLTRRGARR